MILINKVRNFRYIYTDYVTIIGSIIKYYDCEEIGWFHVLAH